MLATVGLRRHFDGVFAIEHTRFTPKPFLAAHQRLLSRYRLDPRRCIMVKDAPENLLPARSLGMKTILVRPGFNRPAWVDVRVRSVVGLVRRGNRAIALG